MPEQTPDLTSVRTLITSVTKLARHLKITPNGIYRWIDVNRIPGKHVVKVANFYNVEIADLLPLTGSDKNNQVLTKLKPRDTLRVLVEVYRGVKTLAAACEELGCSEISAKLILTNWGDELPTLYTTMEQLAEKRISLETAMERLNVSKYTLHGLRRKYGYQPGRRVAKVKEPKAPSDNLRNEIALTVLSGKMSAIEAAEHFKVGYRSVFRYVDAVTKERLNDIAHWPDSFRKAFAEELRQKMPSYVQKWFEFADRNGLMIKKYPKYPKIPENWKELPIKRLLVGVLLGEAGLEEIAASRGGDPSVMAAIFTSDLRPMGVTFEELVGLPLPHQMAMGELLLAVLDRKRKLPAHVRDGVLLATSTADEAARTRAETERFNASVAEFEEKRLAREAAVEAKAEEKKRVAAEKAEAKRLVAEYRLEKKRLVREAVAEAKAEERRALDTGMTVGQAKKEKKLPEQDLFSEHFADGIATLEDEKHKRQY